MMPARLVVLCCLVAASTGTRAATPMPPPAEAPACSPAWERAVEAALPVGDGQGHGPDLGSDEWKSALEFRLGVRGQAGLPVRDSAAWCDRIDALVRARAGAAGGAVKPVAASAAGAAAPKGPAFSCKGVEAGSIEALVCGDAQLSALDRQLDGVYRAALAKAKNERPPVLKATQRGWVKGRNDCWKDSDRTACVRDAYRRRTAELQATYRLLPGRGPQRYQCGASPADELSVTRFDTDPPTLQAERGDQTSLMYLQPDGSFLGRNERLREQAGGVELTWGYGAAALACREQTACPAPCVR